jgi:fatty-acyl-CoA synthase
MTGLATSDSYDAPHLRRSAANYAPLSPVSFLARAAAIYPDKTAIIHGSRRISYAEFYERCRRLADALRQRGIGPGDVVAIMAPNVPAMLEAHYGVAMASGVLNALNYRLDARSIAFILDHGGAKIVLSDREFAAVMGEALSLAANRPLVVDIDDPLHVGGAPIGEIDYDAFLASGDPAASWQLPADEWQAIALGYTSGTTGNPKGVVIHHRGAYLSTPWATPSPSASLPSRSISGPCRCSTATAGPIPGRLPPPAAPMSACAGSSRRPSSPRSPTMASPICAARRSS